MREKLTTLALTFNSLTIILSNKHKSSNFKLYTQHYH